ncbi:MAG: hypothetical protein HKN20_14955 [Gemmatimonadetes bacterium]|nr:hypothetical protein [Gemmatimonadota bacterium]
MEDRSEMQTVEPGDGPEALRVDENAEERPAGDEASSSDTRIEPRFQEFREIPAPREDTFWGKLKTTLRDGYHVAANKTDLYTRIGRKRLQIVGLKKRRERLMTQFGEMTYPNLTTELWDQMPEDAGVKLLAEQIAKVDEEVNDLERAIAELQEEASKETDSADSTESTDTEEVKAGDQ